MKDRLAKYPGRYTAVVDTEKIEKGIPFNIEITRADEPTEEGTPYNKEAVLPDDLASLICAGIENPTPADAFRGVYNASARSGYGLGETVSPAQTWKQLRKNSFHRSSSDSPDGTLWWGITNANNGYSGTQIAFTSQNDILTEAKRLITAKTTSGINAGTWEYVNPPMAGGVEYRTTERFAGKPVYVYVIGIGYLPNTGTKTTAHNIENISGVISIHGIASDGRTIPYKNGNESIEVAADKTNIYVTTTTNMMAQNGTLCIKYIKTTD